MKKEEISYTKFELLKYYFTAYKLYKLERKYTKHSALAKKYDDSYKELKLALHAGFHSANNFTKTINNINDSQIGKNRLRKLAGIVANTK